MTRHNGRYYTGLTDDVMVTVAVNGNSNRNDGNGTAGAGGGAAMPVKMQLERDYVLLLKLDMPPSSYTTVLLSVP